MGYKWNVPTYLKNSKLGMKSFRVQNWNEDFINLLQIEVKVF